MGPNLSTLPFEGVLVQHPLFMCALERVSDFERRTAAGDKLILPIFGPTRVGKNFTTKLLQMRNRPRREDNLNLKPCLLVKTPPKPTLRSLPEAILLSMGLPGATGGVSNDALTGHVRGLIKRARTKYIIFDEVQQFVEARSRVTNRQVSDWLKNFSETTDVSLILLGLPSAAGFLDSNEQLRDRALAPYHLLPYNWVSVQQRAQFEAALVEILQLTRDHGYVIALPANWERAFYASSGGRIGMVVKLLSEAFDLAREHRRIDPVVLAQAHARTVDRQTIAYNPFERGDLTDQDAINAFLEVMKQSEYSVELMAALMRREGQNSLSEQDQARLSAARLKQQTGAFRDSIGC
jgi:hypothetical protein